MLRGYLIPVPCYSPGVLNLDRVPEIELHFNFSLGGFALVWVGLVDFGIWNWRLRGLGPCLLGCLFGREGSNPFVASRCARGAPLSCACGGERGLQASAVPHAPIYSVDPYHRTTVSNHGREQVRGSTCCACAAVIPTFTLNGVKELSFLKFTFKFSS